MKTSITLPFPALPSTTMAKRWGKMMLQILLMLGSVVAFLGLVGWVGLQVKPAPFPAVPRSSSQIATVPLPQGLPVPVARFYRAMYGEQIPLIRTAVISGRGWMRPPGLFGLKFPIRFRFTHVAGQDYRHYIEVTLFGLPVMKVNEYYVDEKERMVMPWGVDENNPKLDQAGNLGMWAESLMWLPSLLVTDPQVRWEPIDEATALLVVPFGETQERFVVRFDPANGKVLYWEAMRYRNGLGDKILWINGTWLDQGRPWVNFVTEQVVYNVTVDTALTARGP
jgi:hypothetical protein